MQKNSCTRARQDALVSNVHLGEGEIVYLLLYAIPENISTRVISNETCLSKNCVTEWKQVFYKGGEFLDVYF